MSQSKISSFFTQRKRPMERSETDTAEVEPPEKRSAPEVSEGTSVSRKYPSASCGGPSTGTDKEAESTGDVSDDDPDQLSPTESQTGEEDVDVTVISDTDAAPTEAEQSQPSQVNDAGKNAERDVGKHATLKKSAAWLSHSAYKWLQVETGDDGKTVVGMLCALCKKFSKLSRNGSAAWVTVPCQSCRKDKVDRPMTSSMHLAAIAAEADHAAAQVTGGIQQAMKDAISLQTKAVRGCLELVYWLVKREIPHTANYSSLLSLVEDLGCEYFSALKVGRNATYSSTIILDEFLDILAAMVKESVLERVKAADTFALMCDESTDIGVLEQLVTYVRYCDKGQSNTHFLSMKDLANGKADVIVAALKEVMAASDLDFDQLCSFGSD